MLDFSTMKDAWETTSMYRLHNMVFGSEPEESCAFTTKPMCGFSNMSPVTTCIASNHCKIH